MFRFQSIREGWSQRAQKAEKIPDCYWTARIYDSSDEDNDIDQNAGDLQDDQKPVF